MSVGTTDWGALRVEPVPGNPDAVHGAAQDVRAWATALHGRAADVRRHAATASGAAGSATIRAYSAAIDGISPDVDALAEACTTAAEALTAFGEVMRTMQGRAAALLEVATTADADRAELVDRLADLDGRRGVAVATREQAEARWVQADRAAAAALAGGAPDAAALEQVAQARRVEVNDARSAVERIDHDITAATDDLDAANDRLEQARADADRLAEEFQSAADDAGHAIGSPPPVSLGRFGDPGSGQAGPASASGGAAAAAGGGGDDASSPDIPVVAPIIPVAGVHQPRPGGVAAASGSTPATAPGRAPVGGGHTGSSAVGASSGPGATSRGVPVPSNPPPGSVVRTSSILDQLREADAEGEPAPVGELTPAQEHFEEWLGRGVQPVAARGAAMARALGFEGVIGGLATRATPSDHTVGLALDLMTYEDIASGHVLAEFFRAERTELWVTYVIFNARICSHREDWLWRPYRHPAGRTDPTAMHLDHVHISFDAVGNSAACAAFGVDC